MKNWKTLIFSTIMIIVTSSIFAAPQLIDKIAAIVNNNVVLDSDIDNLMQAIRLNTNQTSQQLLDYTNLRHQILERLILDEVVLQIGQKIGIKVTEEQLDKVIDNIAKQNNMTTKQMRNRLAYNNINYNIYRDQIRKEMVITEVRNNAVGRRINILPQEINIPSSQKDTTNAEFNLSYILIPLPENPTSDQVAKAGRRARYIIYHARNNSSYFSKLTTVRSADQLAIKSGQIGWGHIQELPSIFIQALSAAKKGDVVGPIRSVVGFYILKVNDLRRNNQKILVTEVHTRHILLNSSPIMTDDQARMKLQQIATDIKSGKTSFANAAKEFSQDLDSASHGGDLGWSAIDIYDPDLRNKLMKLNKGQMIGPVHSSFGWHLIELLDTRNVDITGAAHIDRAYRILFNRKFSEEAAMWMQEQRANAYVKVLRNY